MSQFPLTTSTEPGEGDTEYDEIEWIVDHLKVIVSDFSKSTDLSPEDGFHLGRIKLAIKYLEEAIGIVEEDHDPSGRE